MNKETFTLYFDQWYKVLGILQDGLKTAPTQARPIAESIMNLLVEGVNWPRLSHLVSEAQYGKQTAVGLSEEIDKMAKYNNKVFVMLSTLYPYAKTQAHCTRLYECAEGILEALIEMEQKEKKSSKSDLDDKTGSEAIDIPDMTSKEKDAFTNQALDQYNKGLIDKDQLRNRLSQLAKRNEDVVRTITGFGNLKL